MDIPPNVTIVDHPLVQHKLTLMRDRNTSSIEFRRLLREISMLMAYEATRDLPVVMEEIETPLAPMDAPKLEGKKLVLVSILRAGGGILEGFLDILPSARVGHIGLYRDPKTLVAVEYYYKLPQRMSDREVIILDPMLATGHSAVAAIGRIQEARPKRIKFLCLLAAPEGLEHLYEHHPEVPVLCAAVDDYLNDHGYIVPGLGDAGDRLYGTK